jgi:hypothetical protein
MGDANTKINNGKDEKLNFLKINFSEITCNFRSSNYRCFPKINVAYEIFENHLWKEKNLLLDVRSKIKNGADSEKIFLESYLLRRNPRLLVSYLQVFS